jgi:hypothetical protein
MDPIIAQMLERRGRYAELVRDGLPIVDAVYWDWPSAMIGGYFLLQLQKARESTGASRLDLRTPARGVRPLDAVIAELEREHRPGFWYRGQRMRRDCVYRGHIPRMENTAPGINPIELTLEAIVPSAYRPYTSPRPATWSQFRLAPPLDYFAGPARAIFASQDKELGECLVSALDFMLIDAMRVSQAGEVRFGYAEHLLAPGSTVTPELFDLISIAQHYEYGSIMVDVSTSIDASAWFATRDWESGEVTGSRGGEPGVIYRIDALAVARALRNYISGPGATPPPAMEALGVFGLADIGERFGFLDRPHAQQGGSLLGMGSRHPLPHAGTRRDRSVSLRSRHSHGARDPALAGRHLPTRRSRCANLPPVQ